MTDNPKLERLARALAESDFHDDLIWADLGENERLWYANLVRAILRELREPDDGMYLAAHELDWQGEVGMHPIQAWEAIIGHLLGEDK